MPRRLRQGLGGRIVHVLNRAATRATLFETADDYGALERVLHEALERHPLRILAYCFMPNHFHVVAWPREDDELSRFMHWFTMTHAQRWRAARESTGNGAVYQGRFKAFPVQSDSHALAVYRYVERNALRARLTTHAELWRWGSLWERAHGLAQPILSASPVPLPADWVARVNQPETAEELAAVRSRAASDRPFGSSDWAEQTARELGLPTRVHPRLTMDSSRRVHSASRRR